MSNLMSVPHTITFESTIDLDKIPSELLPALLALSKEDVLRMCKEATLAVIAETNVLSVANKNNSWAEVTIKEGN
jgi:hypothetical protein